MTYGALKTRIADDLDRQEWTVIEAAIQDAIARWETTRFTINEGTVRLTTVAGQAFYDLPDDLRDRSGNALQGGVTLLGIDKATIIYNDSGYWLQKIHEHEAELWDLVSHTGQPNCYSWLGNQIRFEPTPDAAYNVYFTGLLRLADLSDDDDANAWTTDQAASRLIRETAKSIINRDYLRDYEAAEAAEASAQRALVQLRDRWSEQSTGYLRPHY